MLTLNMENKVMRIWGLLADLLLTIEGVVAGCLTDRITTNIIRSLKRS